MIWVNRADSQSVTGIKGGQMSVTSYAHTGVSVEKGVWTEIVIGWSTAVVAGRQQYGLLAELVSWLNR